MFKVKDWHTFQSYKDRSPPWIRLHKRLLDDFDYQRMSAEARALLPMLWLMASEDKDPVSGMLRFGYEVIAFRLRQPEKAIKSAMAEIVAAGFVEQINEAKSASYGFVTDSLRNCHSETETETETETDYSSVFEEFWKIYPKKRIGAKDKALAKFKQKAEEHGIDAIMAGVKAYAASEEVERGFAKGCAAWLNDDRFLSEYSPAKKDDELNYIERLRRDSIHL